MRKFIPAEGFNRVTFAARGEDSLVIVDKAGLEVAESEVRPVMEWDEDAQAYAEVTREVPVNENLLSALVAHQHVTEVTTGYVPPVVSVIEDDVTETPGE